MDYIEKSPGNNQLLKMKTTASSKDFKSNLIKTFVFIIIAIAAVVKVLSYPFADLLFKKKKSFT